MAAQFIAELPHDTLVVHQVRHPLAVVASYVVRGFFDRGGSAIERLRRGAKTALRRRVSDRERHVAQVRGSRPAVFREPSAVLRAAHYWVSWNEMIEHDCRAHGLPYLRRRVESYTADDFVEMIGHVTTPDVDRVRDAVTSVSRTTNTGKPPVRLQWHELAEWEQPARALAKAYGSIHARQER